MSQYQDRPSQPHGTIHSVFPELSPLHSLPTLLTPPPEACSPLGSLRTLLLPWSPGLAPLTSGDLLRAGPVPTVHHQYHDPLAELK